jgi:transcriptional regulator with XRE-family HTH domain
MLPSCERTIFCSRASYLPSHNRGIPIAKQPKTIGEHLRRRRAQLHHHQSQAARLLNVSTVTLSRWECDKIYPVWKHHQLIIDYLGYDPFPSCGLKDPYGNETNGVASFSPTPLCQRLKTRRLELKLTVKECAKNLDVDPKTLRSWEAGTRQLLGENKTRIVAFVGTRRTG